MNKYKPNNIYNVDCYEAIKGIPDKSIDLVYIDIPYLIDHGGGGHSKLAQRINKINKIDLDSISKGIDYSIFDELVRVMKYIYIYIWCSKEQILDIMKIFIDKYNCRYNLLVWCKSNPIPATNNVWLPDLEYCLVFKEKGAPRYNDGYELKSKWYVSPINKNDKELYEHPTVKPLNLVKRHILHSTKPNDIVLDCFMGSGTTAVACKETGRRYIGFEIDEEYYKIAVNRLNGISQKDIKNKEKGIISIFDFIEQEKEE